MPIPLAPHPLPSERSFGVLFAVVFAAVAGYALFADWPSGILPAAAMLSAALLAIAWLKPQVLAPFNKAWFALGLFLGRIVGPIVQGAIFFLLISPIALLMRLARRDALRLRRADVASYWIEKTPSARDSSSFKNPF